MKAGIMKIINAAFCTSWKTPFPWKWIVGSTVASAREWFSFQRVLWGAMNELASTTLYFRGMRDTKERGVQLSTLACLAVRVRHYFSFINTQLISTWLNLELSHDRMWLFLFAFTFLLLQKLSLMSPATHVKPWLSQNHSFGFGFGILDRKSVV